MDNEKFFNYYIKNLTNSLNEAVNKNIVLQTQQSLAMDELKELKDLYDNTQSEFQRIISENTILRNEMEKLGNFAAEIDKYKTEIFTLTKQIDALKSSGNHVETFKNELIKARKDVEDLRAENESLKDKSKDSSNAKMAQKQNIKITPKSNTKIAPNNDDF